MNEETEHQSVRPLELAVDGNGGPDGRGDSAQSGLTRGGDLQTAPRPIGKVASPPQKEATTDQFYFWVPGDELVERTQIVWTHSHIGQQEVRFYAIVDEVFRQSRKRSVSEEFDAFDGDLGYEPPFAA